MMDALRDFLQIVQKYSQSTTHHSDDRVPSLDPELDEGDMFVFDDTHGDDELPVASSLVPLDTLLLQQLVGHRWTMLDFSGLTKYSVEVVARELNEPLVLGRGATSTVVVGRMRSPEVECDVAVKCISLNSSICVAEGDDTLLMRADKEFHTHGMMRTLQHTHVIRCLGYSMIVWWREADDPHTEYRCQCLIDNTTRLSAQLAACTMMIALERGSETLSSVLLRQECLTEILAARMLLQVSEALDYLHHTADIVHGDVKPQNVLLFYHVIGEHELFVEQDFIAKLGDFGCAARLTDQQQNVLGGTPIYMSPQAARGIVHPSNDVWSLGIMAVHILMGRPPWSGIELQFPAVLLAGLRQDPPVLPQLEDFRNHRNQGTALWLFVERCLTLDKDQRIDAHSCVEELKRIVLG